MDKKTDSAIIWLTISLFVVICGFAVTFYNQYQTISLKNRQLSNDLKLENYLRGENAQLNHDNDSIFKANDSLNRHYVYIQFDSATSRFIGIMHMPITTFDSIISSKNKP
jgi:hypothetical protein